MLEMAKIVFSPSVFEGSLILEVVYAKYSQQSELFVFIWVNESTVSV